jgi:hypothetical protein
MNTNIIREQIDSSLVNAVKTIPFPSSPTKSSMVDIIGVGFLL